MSLYLKSRRGQIAAALTFAALFILLMLPWIGKASSDFSYNVSAKYQVGSDASTRVEQTYVVTNSSVNKYLQSIEISTPVDDPRNIIVEYSDGTSIPFSTEAKTSDQSGYSYSYKAININFPRKNIGQNSWSFIVSYDTNKLVETKGSAHTVSIPALPQDGSEKYNVEILVPESFGSLHTTGVKPISQGNRSGYQKYIYPNKELLNKTSLLVFGDSTVYEVNFNFPLKNNSSFTNTYTVTLPPTTSGQEILVQNLDPQPKSTHIDQDGNMLADYDVPAKTNVVVKTSVIGVVRYLEYNLSASGTQKDIPKDLVSRYTGAQKYWPSDNPQILAKAKELTQSKRTVADQIRAINDFVVADLSYNNDKIKYNIRQGGLKALQNPSNSVCLEYSDLTVSLLRAAGIPARMPIGYGYSGSLKQSNSVTDSLHSWVQAYVPNVGWINLDPTWNEKFNNFGSSDLDHMAFAVWGVRDSGPSAVMQNGQDMDYQYEDTTLSYRATPPSISQDGKLSAKKWLILPFLSFTVIDIQAPSITVGESYVIRARQGVNNRTFDIGSLTPRQMLHKFIPNFGPMAFGVLNVDFTQSGSSSLILGSTKVDTQTWPMWFILIVISGIIIYKMIKSKSINNSSTQDLVDKPIANLKKAAAEKEEHEEKPKK